jgi:hypothetical protein
MLRVLTRESWDKADLELLDACSSRRARSSASTTATACPAAGGKFAIDAADEVRSPGRRRRMRPVARQLDDGGTLEILRICTDATPNANSFLYARARRIALLVGYQRVITAT